MESNQRLCPYVGLTPFTENDAAYFFGREDETRRIASKLYASRLTLLYGASGVGKSSVLRAGVLKSLRDDNVGAFYFNTWQSDPVAMLRIAIGGEIPILLLARGEIDGNTAAQFAERFLYARGDAENEMTRFADRLRAAPSLGDFLKLAAERVGALMIVLDQFEEYFLYHPRDDAGNSFALEFAQALNRDDVPASFLIGIREDAYTKMDRFKGRIPNLFSNYTHLAHLNTDAARAAIEKPIEQYNRAQRDAVSIEPALVDAVLEQVQTGRVVIGEAGRGAIARGDAAGQIETPFLQLVMTRLWEETYPPAPPSLKGKGDGGLGLQLETLTRLGGAEKIVRTHLDGVMGNLSDGEKEICSAFFDRLVTPSGTKIAQTSDDLIAYTSRTEEKVVSVLKSLADARVLRTVAPPPDRPTATRYEIFHDVLAPAILDWRRRYVEKQERAREQQRVRRLRFAFLGAAALLLVFAALAFFALQQRGIADEQRAQAITQRDAAATAQANAVQAQATAETNQNIATSRELAAAAYATLDGDPELSVLLAIEANRASHTYESEDILRQALLAHHLKMVLRGHTDWVNSVAVSPDGKQIATGSYDNTARIWDVVTGREVTQLRGHMYSIRSIAFSPDGKQIATGSDDGTARIWVVATGREVTQLRGHTGLVTSVAFSPDGNHIVTGSNDGTARLWNVATGREVTQLHGQTVNAVAFSPDGKQIVTGGDDGTARIWDVTMGREVMQLRGHTREIDAVAFSPDGKQIATASHDNTARLWDAATGRVLTQLSGHTSFVVAVTYSPDGKQIATGSVDKTARIWDVASGGEVMQLRGHTNWVTSVAYSPDGKQVVTGSEDSTARIWDVASGGGITQLRGHTNSVYSVAFSPDGNHIVTGSNDGTARLWNVATGREVTQLRGQMNSVHSVAFSPDGKQIATGSDDKTARIWDVASGGEVTQLRGHTNSVYSVAFSPDGKQIATGSDDGTARIWDVATGREVMQLRGTTLVISVAFSPDGRQIATGSQVNTARIWDVVTGREATQLRGTGPIISVAFNPDGKRIVTGSADFTARIWDVATGREVTQLLGHTDWVKSVAVSLNGKQIATGSSDHTARIWDATTGHELAVLRGHASGVTSVAFSPDGKQIVTGSYDNTARVYLTQIEDLIALAKTRVTRTLTCEEREKYLHEPPCPTPTPLVTPTRAP